MDAPAPRATWAGECGACGWHVYARSLPAGMTVEEALEIHRRRTCAPPWLTAPSR